MFRRPIAPWRDVIPSLQTGDLIFFRGHGFFSKGIEFVTGGVWSHVAMVIEGVDIYPDLPRGQLLLWESTTYPALDIDMNPKKMNVTTGAMLVDLEDRLEEYFERLGYSHLSARYLHVERTQTFRDNIASFVKDPGIRAATYPKTSHLMWYYFRERYLQVRPERTFFCSELVAATYQAAKLLPPNPSCTSYCPRDFSENGFVPRLLRSEFGEEIHIGRSEQDRPAT